MLEAYRWHRALGQEVIAAFPERVADEGCTTIILGVLAGQRTGNLYSKLGFVPAFITRTWVHGVPIMR